jgi:oxidase EvaA
MAGPEGPISAWLADRRTRSALTVTPIPFARSREWVFGGGRLHHRSGRYFSISGLHVRFDGACPSEHRQPIIDQPEHGILAFLARRGENGWQVLTQAKSEPGNADGTQIAPTVQATVSNYERVHGGAAQPFLDRLLAGDRRDFIADILQSEQGSRFLRKRNRNAILVLDEATHIDHGEAFRWLSLAEVAALLRADHLVNTDARSVLACLPPRVLSSDPGLRARREVEGDFAAARAGSLLAPEPAADLEAAEIEAWTSEFAARHRFERRTVPLADLPDWRIGESAIRHHEDRDFAIRQYAVSVRDREVPAWDQPLLSSPVPGVIGFLCQIRRGVLHLLAQARAEPGSGRIPEIAATVQCRSDGVVGPGEAPQPYYPFFSESAPADVRLRIRQTDEGGRFHLDESLYTVVEVPEREPVPDHPDYRWLTLSQFAALLREPARVTNEARSLLAPLFF